LLRMNLRRAARQGGSFRQKSDWVHHLDPSLFQGGTNVSEPPTNERSDDVSDELRETRDDASRAAERTDDEVAEGADRLKDGVSDAADKVSDAVEDVIPGDSDRDGH
jgi:hypothetical protein